MVKPCGQASEAADQLVDFRLAADEVRYMHVGELGPMRPITSRL
jgi:hypothetical protein